MYKRILVPLDGSKLAGQVLPYVRVLAKTRQVPIIPLKAFDLIHLPSTAPSHSVYMDRLFNHYRSDAERLSGTCEELPGWTWRAHIHRCPRG